MFPVGRLKSRNKYIYTDFYILFPIEESFLVDLLLDN